MRVVVLEYFSLLPDGAAPAGLLAEGAALRDAVATDLALLPDVELEIVAPPAPRPSAALRAALGRAEAALLIAPESDGILGRLTACVERSGRIPLGPGRCAVGLAADKLAMSRLLNKRGIAAPGCASIRFADAPGRLRSWSPPFVIKPRDGCGGQGARRVRRREQIPAALDAVRAATRRRDFLVQELVPGEPASVSFLVAQGCRCVGLGLNRQSITVGGAGFEYRGGVTPWPHPRRAAAIRAAARAVRALGGAVPDLRGYVGVDLMIGPGGVTILEINPRLTTSYLGLRHVVERNLSGLLIDAALGRPIPRRIERRGACRFATDGSLAMDAAGRGRGGRWRSASAGTSAARI
jgi:predicted ATP-grasp superfamily ATP-dependent carboligase